MTNRESMQKIFNKVWNHFVVNKGQKAQNEDGCAYRDEDGNKCAIGCLVPDDVYNESMDEGVGFNYLIRTRSKLADFFQREYGFVESDHVMKEFIDKLRKAHDYCYDPFTHNIKVELMNIANAYLLTIPSEY